MAQKNRQQRRHPSDRPRTQHSAPKVEKDLIPSSAEADAAKKDAQEEQEAVDLGAEVVEVEKILAFKDRSGVEHYLQPLVAREVRYIVSLVQEAQVDDSDEVVMSHEDLYDIAKMCLSEEAWDITETASYEAQAKIIKRVFQQAMKKIQANAGN